MPISFYNLLFELVRLGRLVWLIRPLRQENTVTAIQIHSIVPQVNDIIAYIG